ncbi:hypothetical protein [Mucilaginibacter endophyticus]|uniref:hypothetical protein n=1 Tax=Mucilaginibacter endophyticus TaxID=2675003 RepID=UPI000E0DB8FA|nr:hypothetical protein [Mucilaginibacter endophyticus]
MELTDHEAVAHFLSEAAEQQWNWVAFDRVQDQPVFRGYVSAGEASAFCAASNNVFDYVMQDFIEADYAFLPVANLAASFVQKPVSTEVNLPDVVQQLSGLQVELQPFWKMDDLRLYLQQELFFPVQWRQDIEPDKEVKRFLVIEHTHPGHHIYEIGHKVNILKYFERQEDGENFLREKAKTLAVDKKPADLILAREYRGRFLKLDLDGYPEQHCGIGLLSVHSNRDGRLQFSTPHSLYRPLTIEQTLYARFDRRSCTIWLHDDQLKRTDPRLLATSTYPTYFIKEILTIKNISIMNQASFEYNRDQLHYMGFGEDIAKVLNTKMEQNLTEFTLDHTRKFGKDELHSVLYFSKGDDAAKDLTFFNRFTSTLKKEGMEDLSQTFFIGPKFNYTLQERYNMMDGRAVYREQPVLEKKEIDGKLKMVPTGDTYWAWRALNFKEADQHGNFLPKMIRWHDQGKVLEKFPIVGAEEKYMQERLLAQLQKGNQVEVNVLQDGLETKAKMVANAPMMRIDFYDENGQKLDIKPVNRQGFEQSQKSDLSPQEVQRAAMAKVTQAKDGAPAADQGIPAAQQAAAEQKQEPAPQRKQAVKI